MDRTKLLIRMSAIYGAIGAILGSHMAATSGYLFRPIHAHILVVGWLSLFAFAMYYRVFTIPKKSILATVHVWSAVLGSLGLTIGMWLYNVKPMEGLETFNLLFYIIGGTILLICFIVFFIMVFVQGRYLGEEK